MVSKFKGMTNMELAAYLREYANDRGGEISDLTREAARRIKTLTTEVLLYNSIMENDGK